MLDDDGGLGHHEESRLSVCSDVHKALLSVSHVADLGYDCTLSKLRGWLTDTETGEHVPLRRRGNFYFVGAWVRPEPSETGLVGLSDE